MKILARRAGGLTELGHFKIWIWIRVCTKYTYIYKNECCLISKHISDPHSSLFYADGDNQLDVKEKRASIVLDNLQLHQNGLWISLGVRAPARQVPDRSRTRTGAYRTCPVLRFYPTSTRNWISGRSCLARQLLFTTNPCFQTVVSDPLVFWWQHTRWTKTKRWKKKISSLQKLSWSD